MQRNQTDKLITDELVGMGTAKEDIVLGLQPMYAREYPKYGIADYRYDFAPQPPLA
ncbi:MAG: element excision factor XisI family protein [Cyanobacteria bacterium J06639_18]